MKTSTKNLLREMLFTALGASLVGLPLCALGFPGTHIGEEPMVCPTLEEKQRTNLHCMDFISTVADITWDRCERAYSGECVAELNECREELRYEEKRSRDIEDDCRSADWEMIEYLCEPWVLECPCRYPDDWPLLPAGEK